MPPRSSPSGSGSGSSSSPPRTLPLAARAWVGTVFLLSGFAALLYQVVWQRSLFAIYGINVEAVTMVVTAFMLGLGLGSLAGGVLSKDGTRNVLRLFALVEALIGAFGLVSLPIFHGVGQATLGLPLAVVFLVTFVLVLLPTMLMGSTLPLLVAFLVRSTGNVGKSVGSLYFVNTIGSAFASALSVVYLLGHQGQKRTVFIAAGFNFTVAVLALIGERLFRSPPVQVTETTKEEVPS